MRISKHTVVFVVLAVTLIICARYELTLFYGLQQKANFRNQSFGTANLRTRNICLSANKLFQSNGLLEWKDNNTELVIAGVYYEVAGISVKNEIASVTLVEDKSETTLFTWLFAELMEEEEDKTNENCGVGFDFEFTLLNRQQNYFRLVSAVSYLSSHIAKERAGFPGTNYLPPKSPIL